MMDQEEGSSGLVRNHSSSASDQTPKNIDNEEHGGEERVKLSDFITMFRDEKISNHGDVYDGEITSDTYGTRSVAIKFIPYSEQNAEEAKIMLLLNPHTHVVSVIHADVYQQGPLQYMYIAMDKCSQENLRGFVENRKKEGNSFDFEIAFSFVKQLFAGMEYVHSKNVVHKDLKPDNVFLSLDHKVIKIGDFGLSEVLKSRTQTISTRKGLGTDGYRPPESFVSGFPTSQKTDIYSLAVIVYFLLSDGKHPFGNEKDLWNYNMKYNKSMDLIELLGPNTEEAKDLITWMLQFVPRNRPTIDQVLGHQYIVPSNVKGILFQNMSKQFLIDLKSCTKYNQDLLSLAHFEHERTEIKIIPKLQNKVKTSSSKRMAPLQLSNLMRVAKYLEEKKKIQIAAETSENHIYLGENFWMFGDKKIQRGSYYTVYEGQQKVLNSSQKPLAIKLDHIENIVSLRRLTFHPNIASIFYSGYVNFEGAGRTFLAMERCNSQPLRTYFEARKKLNIPFDFPLALNLSKQIVSALQHLHLSNFIHKYLSLNNIFFSLDMESAKVILYGLARTVAMDDTSMAPESVRAPLSMKSNIFSLAVILYYLLSYGSHPFGDDLFQQVLNIKYNVKPELNELLCPNPQLARDLLMKMLDFVPENRLCIEEVSNHEFWRSLTN
ncbi:uncharacterized protein LOC120340365 [Styela clava]